jgi:hypothetical protein
MSAGDISRVMKLRVRKRVGDESAQVFPDAEVYCWLSEALRDVSSRLPDLSLGSLCATYTWGPGTTDDGAISAGQSAYDLPADFLRERALKYTDASAATATWAERIPVRELKLQAEVLRAASGAKPYYWFWNGQVNVEVGTVAAADSFTLYYVKHPADYDVSVNTAGTESLAAETGAISDSVDPTIPRHYFRAIEEFAVARCSEVLHQADTASYFMQTYEKLLTDIKARYVVPGDPADDIASDGVSARSDNA